MAATWVTLGNKVVSAKQLAGGDLVMASTAAATARQGLVSQLDTILAMDVQKHLVRSDVLGQQLDFSAAAETFQNIHRICQQMKDAPLEGISDTKLDALSRLAQNMIQQLEQIRGFSVTSSGNPKQTRDQSIQNLKGTYDEFFDGFAPVLGYATQNSQHEEQAGQMLNIIRARVAEQEAILKGMEEILQKAKQAAQEIGVVQEAKVFAQEAKDHKQAADKWLTATVLFAIGTLSILVVNLRYAYQTAMATAGSSPSLGTELSAGRIAQLALAKVLLFSALFSVVVWMGKVYRAHRHNYVINKHRQNALTVFETFVKGVSEPATKDAVLMAATRCVFSPQATGYLTHEGETEGNPQVLEIVRGMANRHA